MMNWVIGIDMYTLMCIKLMTNKDLLYKKINKIQQLKKKRCQGKQWAYDKVQVWETSTIEHIFSFIYKEKGLHSWGA